MVHFRRVHVWKVCCVKAAVSYSLPVSSGWMLPFEEKRNKEKFYLFQPELTLFSPLSFLCSLFLNLLYQLTGAKRVQWNWNPERDRASGWRSWERDHPEPYMSKLHLKHPSFFLCNYYNSQWQTEKVETQQTKSKTKPILVLINGIYGRSWQTLVGSGLLTHQRKAGCWYCFWVCRICSCSRGLQRRPDIHIYRIFHKLGFKLIIAGTCLPTPRRLMSVSVYLATVQSY